MNSRKGAKPQISLCLIAGNVEEYIERCLKSFALIADEICIVRAIGNQKPDATLDIAHQLASDLNILTRTADYINAPDHADWKHLDNFAAARQQSFDMATGKYIFWCDTDDVLQAGAEVVRELAEKAEYDCYIFPYEIFGQHVSVPRERMVKHGSGRWTHPVHEFFKFNEEVDGYRDDRVIVRHQPMLEKSGSVERNLRILRTIPDKEMPPGLRYQLHCELVGAGRKHEAFEAAKKALESGGLGKPETYQLLIHLATFSKDPRTTESYLIAAYQADPCRREALGLLAGHMIDYGQPTKALAFARQMLATEPPAESWNDRKNAYTWLGVEIMQQALRANNRFDEAEKLRTQMLARATTPIISLIHASRGRPKRAAIARKLWFDLAENPEAIEHIFVLDSDDDESMALRRMHHITIAAGGGCVAAWNMGAGVSIGKVIIQMSDDWLPPPRWDKLILERFAQESAEIRDQKSELSKNPSDLRPLTSDLYARALQEPKVLAISDGHRTDNLLCMAIMTRAYFNQDWFMFHPDFTGVYSDNYFTDVAYARGQVIEARDLIFKHDHPAFTAGAADETYLRQNSPKRYVEGLKVYERLKEQRDWSQVPGFFNFWPFYGEIAVSLKDGDTVAEIGVWLGRSIIYLAQMCQRLGKKVKFIAVDSFKGESGQPAHAGTIAAHSGSIRKEFEENIKRCGVADMIDILQGDSAKAAAAVQDGSIAFCFIDAAHDYESVKRDISAWKPKVKPGGILAGHDIQWPEVRRAVEELIPAAKMTSATWFWKSGFQPDLADGLPARQTTHVPLQAELAT